MTTTQISQLSDEALIAAAVEAAANERRTTADLIRLLMEVDQRRLYLSHGHASMFVYCTRALGLSEQAAYSRITASRAARRFPLLLRELDCGGLTLSSVGLLAPHLTSENAETLIDDARRRSTRDVERMVASVQAQPDIPSSIRALPLKNVETSTSRSTPAGLMFEPGDGSSCAASDEAERQRTVVLPTPAIRASIAPIAARRYLLKLTIGESTHDKLQRLRDLMRHAVPNGDPAEILDRALALLLSHVEQQKSAVTSRPRSRGDRPANGRYIPATVRRVVWVRDAGRCAFDGTDGRCRESAFLEFHHVVPFAAGGAATVDNIELRCRAHNAHEAVLFFGPDAASVQSPGY